MAQVPGKLAPMPGENGGSLAGLVEEGIMQQGPFLLDKWFAL